MTSLRLEEHEIDNLIFRKLAEMENYVKRRAPFLHFESWPADAQLGLLSMAWGMGPAFNFPRFENFVSQGNWCAAATECRFQPDTGTIKIRNDRNQNLFRNAALGIELGLDPAELLWPQHKVIPLDEASLVCDLHDESEPGFDIAAAFDVEVQFAVDPAGFTRGYGGPGVGGRTGSNWYIRWGMDIGAVVGTAVYASFDGHVTKYTPHNPAADAGGVYGAQIFMRYPNDKMGAFYTHITNVPSSIQVGANVERGDYLGTVLSFGGIPPHLHLALVEIIGGAPGGEYKGVDLYPLFLELHTTYSKYFVPVRFAQDGTPPMPQWGIMEDSGAIAREPVRNKP